MVKETGDVGFVERFNPNDDKYLVRMPTDETNPYPRYVYTYRDKLQKAEAPERFRQIKPELPDAPF